MPKKSRARYGSWSSPITADSVARQSVRFGEIVVDGDVVYWVESRPVEKGRSVIVRFDTRGEISDVIVPPYSARSRVHEYGGAAFIVHKGVVFFTNFSDQQIYRQGPDGVPICLTREKDKRFADFAFDAHRGRLVCVEEDHAHEGEPANVIADIDIDGVRKSRTLVSGNDFYSSPRLSPDGSKIAWLTWNHPDMPWDGTELWVAKVSDDGSFSDPFIVCGGHSESIFQPEWSPDGILYFVSDRNGWWNIKRSVDGRVESVTDLNAEFGLPQWNFSLTTYGFISRDMLACAYNRRGIWYVATVDLRTKELKRIESQYTRIANLKTVGDWLVFHGGSPTRGLTVVKHNITTLEETVIRDSADMSIDPGDISIPQSVEFTTANGMIAHGFYYPPQNRDYDPAPNEMPPLIVITHGGPTSCSYTSLEMKIQYWTSRGFAVLDVNYGGSTGYGRTYRERLKGNWGVVDVDDCVNGAKHLVSKGLADGNRVIIRGSSAGGYTTLAALTFRDYFKAGASYYGVTDLEALAKETHKFESYYLDSLVGPYPNTKHIYRERSPLYHSERLSAPVIFFQGLEDEVVPPDQARKMVGALRRRGVPVAYITFEGEQHGFRNADNIRRALEAELYFYSRIFGFELSEDVEPVKIENM
ncbi:MAG: S9 family peptidase [candidate division WOR-3 bacterium]|nr:MAG: S9 family peptidase [candidate division WOR-3 bacterium]